MLLGKLLIVKANFKCYSSFGLLFSNLIVRSGEPEVVLPSIISQLGKENVEVLAFQQEVSVNFA